jgi:hypothetical protein
MVEIKLKNKLLKLAGIVVLSTYLTIASAAPLIASGFPPGVSSSGFAGFGASAPNLKVGVLSIRVELALMHSYMHSGFLDCLLGQLASIRDQLCTNQGSRSKGSCEGSCSSSCRAVRYSGYYN